MDADGMEDSWEATMGLNAHDASDAFQDADGDRVPNLWEFYQHSAANSISDLPRFDATVDITQRSDPSRRQFATLQEAYDAMPPGDVSVAMVDVKPGIYVQGVDGTTSAKRIAWLAREGGVILSGGTSGMKLSDETVIDGFEFASANGPDVAAVQIKPHADLGDAVPEVRIVNCIINGRISSESAGVGGIVNDGGDLWVVQCTVAGNVGGQVDGVLNQRGSLHIVNSIVWNVRSGKLQELLNRGQSSHVSIVNSVLRGTSGQWGTDPKLTLAGHLTKASLACLGRGTADAGAPIDLHGSHRYGEGISGVDLGAEQWVDDDNDGLPDWWEGKHFENTKNNGTTAAGGGLTLAQAYQLGIDPATSRQASSNDKNKPSVRITFPANDSVVR